jgi:hypothetical protein
VTDAEQEIIATLERLDGRKLTAAETYLRSNRRGPWANYDELRAMGAGRSCGVAHGRDRLDCDDGLGHSANVA